LGVETQRPGARVALRTQQVLAHESGVADVVDPLGGSPLIEALTDELERRALEPMETVEKRGGAVRAIESGFVQREIHLSALAAQRALEAGKSIVVGLNQFQTEEGEPELFKPSDAARAEVLATLARVRAERDGTRVDGSLRALEEAARGRVNLLPPIAIAVEAYATIGEICGRLERVFGRYKPPEGF
ncbi:MAG: methylmalonyl-CoA mutase, partial [Planctomycetes bacterium]|nr:methylmalonyl-CoA mutase [Planctomycetota bacterium]